MFDHPQHPLRAYRRANGISLGELAHQVGVSEATLSRIETWKQTPSLSLVGVLRDKTGLTADAFLPTEIV